MPTKTASQLDEAMLDIYRRAKAEANYVDRLREYGYSGPLPDISPST